MSTDHNQQKQKHNVSKDAPSSITTVPRSPRNRSRRRAIPFVVFLVPFVLLVIAGAIFSLHTTQPATLPSTTITTEQQPDIRQMGYQQLAARTLSHMSLDEKLGQLFMVGYNTSTYSSELDRMITKLHAGGVILYQVQIQTTAQAKRDIAKMQKHASLPLFISTDEEGGYVDRLANIYPSRPSAMTIYRTGDLSLAAQAGHQTAHDLLSLGINVNLAPDSDVQLVNGPDQITRTFGFTPQSVISFAGAYMQAMQQDGVIACIKHFPGLGAATTDAHTDLPVVRRSKAQIYDVELAPFKAFVQAQNEQERPGMIMTTNVLIPAIDPQFPAVLSHTFITDILRKQFGYNGVVITDALSMQGIAKNWDISQAAVMALNAGNDMLLGVGNAEQMASIVAGLKSALQHGTLSQTRIDEAVTHILTLKLQYHLLSSETR